LRYAHLANLALIHILRNQNVFTAWAEGVGAPGLDFLDKLSQATGSAHAPDRESVRHACLWKATIMLFSRDKVAYEKKRKIMWNVASVAEPTKSFYSEIDKSRLTLPAAEIGTWPTAVLYRRADAECRKTASRPKSGR
jgi:hypothetical protein